VNRRPLPLLLAALVLLAAAPAAPASHRDAVTRAVGAKPLPDRTAARRVHPTRSEVRPGNRRANRRLLTRGELARFRRESDMEYRRRVTGRYRGTTDDILEWAAHKHGIREDLVRAVAVKESWWRMDTVGDDGDSFGIMQMRRPFHCCLPFMARATAFNADYWGAIVRAYFDGRMRWLNDVERGREYRRGDMWGSVGAWFAGRWHTPGARAYIADVRRIMRERTWRRREFRGG
jgi:hypothetical protein